MKSIFLSLLLIPTLGFGATNSAEKDVGVCLGYIAVLKTLAQNNQNFSIDYSIADEEWDAYMIANKEDLDKHQIQAYAESYFQASSSVQKIVNATNIEEPAPSVRRYIEQGINSCGNIGVTSFKTRK